MAGFKSFSIGVLSLVLLACESPQPSGKLSPDTIDHLGLPDSVKISPPEDMYVGGKIHYAQRVKEIAARAPLEGGILFLGDSITEGGDWAELFPERQTANHGIGWDTVAGVSARLPQVLLSNPKKVFIKIGTNDIGYGHDPAQMAAELEDIIAVLKSKWPDAKIYLQSILPREFSNKGKVSAINAAYRRAAKDMDVPFIDLTSAFSAPNGAMRADLSDDEVHLTPKGYDVWAAAIRPYVLQD